MGRTAFKHFAFLVSKNCPLWVVLICVLAIAEVYFGWIECLVGRWLLFGNDTRPESGLFWDTEHKKQIANDQLKKLFGKRFSQNQSRSFVYLLNNSDDVNEVIIFDYQIIDFYKQLPFSISDKLFSPYLIVKIYSEHPLNHIYFKKQGNRGNVFLLNKENSTLNHNLIFQGLIDSILMTKIKLDVGVGMLINFKGKIHSLANFFLMMLGLPEDIQRITLAFYEKIFDIECDF